MQSQPRPNILVISTDQQRADCLGVAGRAVKTPHLDRLANRGTRFANCITASPICQPARASILTGMLPLTHGVVDNGIDLDPDVADTGFAARVSAQGYRTGFIGKAHFSTKLTFEPTGRPECQYSSADYGPEWTGPYMGFEHAELMLGTMTDAFPPLTPPAGQHFERWFAPLRDEALALWARRQSESHTPQTWTSDLPTAWHPSNWVADRSIAFLEKAAAEDTPFCLWASIADPHHPFDCPEPWASLHHPDAVDPPEVVDRDEELLPWWHAVAKSGTPAIRDSAMRAFRTGKSRMPDLTDDQLRRMIANYYGMIALADHAVGRILAVLDTLDLTRDTIVIFTSDHGDLLGDHGLSLKGPTLYDGLLRVPLLISGPGLAQGQVVTTPVSLTDLAATICAFAGCADVEDASRQSRDLGPGLRGEPIADRPVYTEWRVDERRFGHALDLCCVRTETAKLTVERQSGAGELYDLDADPGETRNLYDDAEAADLREHMVKLITDRPGSMRQRYDPPVGMS